MRTMQAKLDELNKKLESNQMEWAQTFEEISQQPLSRSSGMFRKSNPSNQIARLVAIAVKKKISLLLWLLVLLTKRFLPEYNLTETQTDVLFADDEETIKQICQARMEEEAETKDDSEKDELDEAEDPDWTPEEIEKAYKDLGDDCDENLDSKSE